MATSVAQLKTYFETGDNPTEQQFVELLEAFIHRDDNLTQILGQMAEINEAQQGLVTDKYMSPLLVYQAIKALTRVANIPELIPEIEAIIQANTNQLVLLADFQVKTTLGVVVEMLINSVLGLKTPDFNLSSPSNRIIRMNHDLGHSNYTTSMNMRRAPGQDPNTFPNSWTTVPDPNASPGFEGQITHFDNYVEIQIPAYGAIGNIYQFQVAITNHNLI